MLSKPFLISNHFVYRARTRARHEFIRVTPVNHGAKLLVAATAMRVCTNEHLATLRRCCAAWEPVGRCFDSTTYECINFHALGQGIAILTRGIIAEREDAVHDGTRLKRSRHWPSVGTVSVLDAPVTDEECRPLNEADDSFARLCSHWSKMFEARADGDQDLSCGGQSQLRPGSSRIFFS